MGTPPSAGGGHSTREEERSAERGYGGMALGGIIIILGLILTFVWSLWIGLIVALVGLVAFSRHAWGKRWTVTVALGCLVALLGGTVGAALGVVVTYVILRGQGADALEWAVTGVFLALIGLVLGAGAGAGVGGYLRDHVASRPTKLS